MGEYLRCSIMGLEETWDGKRDLLVKDNVGPLEARIGDPTNNYFQAVTTPNKNRRRLGSNTCYVSW